jgi:hypothetical protein
MNKNLLIINLIIDIVVHAFFLLLSLWANNTIYILLIVLFFNFLIYAIYEIKIKIFLLVFSIGIFFGFIFYSNYYKDGNTIIISVLTSLTFLYCFLLHNCLSSHKISWGLLYRHKIELLIKTILSILFFLFMIFIELNFIFDFNHRYNNDLIYAVIIASLVIIPICNAIITLNIFDYITNT